MNEVDRRPAGRPPRRRPLPAASADRAGRPDRAGDFDRVVVVAPPSRRALRLAAGGPRSVSSCGSAGSRCLLVDQAPHGGGEVVAPLGVAARTSRTRRSRATAAPRHRARPARRPTSTASAIEPAATTGRAAREGSRHLVGGLADGDDGPDVVGRGLGQHRQVEALVVPAGDQHHRVEARARRPRWRAAPWPWSRRTSATPRPVADPARPGGAARRSVRSVCADAVEVGAALERGGRGGQRVGQVVGQAPRQLVDGRPAARRSAVRSSEPADPVARAGRSTPKVTVRTSGRTCAITTGSSALATATPPGRRGRPRSAPWPLRSGRASRARRGGPRRS